MEATHPTTKEPLCLSMENTNDNTKQFIIVKKIHGIRQRMDSTDLRGFG